MVRRLRIAMLFPTTAPAAMENAMQKTLALMAVAAALSVSSGVVAQDPAKPTIVLVHGAFADSSGWNGVITQLNKGGYRTVAAPNALRGVANDAAIVASVLKTIQGDVVLVAHSYGGMVISQAADGQANVKPLSATRGGCLSPILVCSSFRAMRWIGIGCARRPRHRGRHLHARTDTAGQGRPGAPPDRRSSCVGRDKEHARGDARGSRPTDRAEFGRGRRELRPRELRCRLSRQARPQASDGR
jgi:pimeloyl-ACP methyl ester carboxylesterase